MSDAELQELFLHRLGLRVEPRMRQYAARQLGQAGPFPVMGGDARTGVPRRTLVDPRLLAPPPPANSITGNV